MFGYVIITWISKNVDLYNSQMCIIFLLFMKNKYSYVYVVVFKYILRVRTI